MNIQTVSPSELNQWIQSDDAVLIDVREPGEHHTARIPNSRLHPLGKITASDIPNTDKKVVIYCQKGLRGENACKKVAKDTHADIYNLTGGLSQWSAQGLATESSGKNILPLDRQVQLTIGTTVLTSSVLAYTVNLNFIWLSAFFGAGLIVAGATGFCGLARVIAKMPWNR